jgi:hypothetical protein
MCYADGGPKGVVSDLTYPAGCTNVASPAWDCDRGDYFDPAPPAGSYLATHWNLFNSVYLCAPATCFTDDGVVGGTGSAATPPPSSGGSSGGGSSGGGGGAGGTSTTTTPTTPTTPTVVPQPTAPVTVPPPRVVPGATAAPQPAQTLAQQIRQALDAVQSGFSRAGALAKLRAGTPVRLRVTVPAGGTLTARLTVRGRTVVRTTARTQATRAATLTLKPTTRARRTLHGSRAAQLALKLSLR